MVLTCDGCGGRRLDDVRDERDFVVRRLEDNRVVVPIPLPLLCLDCGSTSATLRQVSS